MKLRSFFYVLATSALALLLVGVIGCFWLIAQSPLTLLAQKSNPGAAIFVSKQAPIVASLLVNPDRLEALQQFVTRPGERRQVRAELEQLKQSLLASLALNYERDVQPWLGDEITLAITTPDIDRNQENGKQPGYLVAISTQNPGLAGEFLQLFWQKQAIAGVDLVFEQYKGLKLIYGNPMAVASAKPLGKGVKNTTSSSTLATAIVGKQFVLLANHPKVLKDAINNVQAEELSLASSKPYEQALNSFTQNRIGLVFMNLPQLTKWLGTSSNLSLSEPKTSSPYESFAVAPSLTFEGLSAETILVPGPGQASMTSVPNLTEPVGALQHIPMTSLLLAAGKDLQQFWSQINTGPAQDETIAQLINRPLGHLQAHWGLNLPQDIFSWVRGEYALSSMIRPGETQPDWIFVAQRSPEAEAAIAHLDEIARRQGLSAGPLMIDNQEVSAWTKLAATPLKPANSQKAAGSLNAQVQGLHTTVGDYEVFATSVTAMSAALKAPLHSLAASPSFKRAVAALPQPNDGYLYIDWSASQPWVEHQLPLLTLVELAAKPVFSRLRSLTISSYGSEAGIRRGEIFIDLTAKDS